MSSIGLADEVLYFFLVESGIVFLTAYIVGVLFLTGDFTRISFWFLETFPVLSQFG